MLDDGSYDVLVVDAAAHDDGTVSVELTVVAGEAKGRVVTVVTRAVEGDPVDLLGLPATLTVAHGTPALQVERGPGPSPPP